ncbi:hypothetical protein JAAARDRAFT_74233 [Jaapia argillacea MUCL 33604]|uniref:CxC5 like cysteine cluster associated with KDZ domain-containing protein n=1 Tax=Jaapia argillacea MUCL 33604 TaxID=933084 RepID=A0A067P6R3_9AGAM|nr:hypothetical protein JAAARDRAFT_74233 [Jaapia argillacea MUCL 33604]
MTSSFLRALSSSPEILDILSVHEIYLFLNLIQQLCARISRGIAPHVPEPPLVLESDVTGFFGSVLGVNDAVVASCWKMFRMYAWDTENWRGDDCSWDSGNLKLFLDHGLHHEIGFRDLEPPTRVCIDPRCALPNGKGPELVERHHHPVTLFTRDVGAVPVWSNSLYCRGCKTWYHPNYYVHDGAMQRTYYAGMPSILQGSKRFYFEASLCERFRNMMVCSWASATNCARIYNLETPDASSRPKIQWPISLKMDCENVWDAFFMFGLLKDQGTSLNLKHKVSSHAIRLAPALEAWNESMVGPGQPRWSHTCNLCCEVQTMADGDTWALRAVITDGVTLGHPCCRVHDCKHDALKKKCAIDTCANEVEAGFQTCSLSDHRTLEDRHREQNRAMFQLKWHLENLKISQTEDSLRTEDGGAVVGDELHDVQCEGKPEEGNRKFRAQFGWRRTHNEELCVATCGVILGRATFFGSEGPNGVFHRTLFPTLQSLPGCIFHDNNCNVKKVLESLCNEYFSRCALPVDVFHMKSKHKESDQYCNSRCNPANWPSLMTVDGKWRFNSSATEITNAWFGGFQLIVREMRVERYNFFLDEMIKIRNKLIVQDLEQKGACLYNIP